MNRKKYKKIKELEKLGIITKRMWWKQPNSPLYELNEEAKKIAKKYLNKKNKESDETRRV